jgi:hypothetical protein
MANIVRSNGGDTGSGPDFAQDSGNATHIKIGSGNTLFPEEFSPHNSSNPNSNMSVGVAGTSQHHKYSPNFALKKSKPHNILP